MSEVKVTIQSTINDIERALSGDAKAARALVNAFTPVIQARVSRALLRRLGAARARDPRQEVEDFTQEVLLVLFANDGKVLRAWEPTRGLSLLNFVGLVAQHEVASIMRSGRRRPWNEEPTEPDSLEATTGPSEDSEARVASREVLGQLLDRLRDQLSPLGLHLFEVLVVERRPVASVCEDNNMSADAVYAWRSRLVRLARKIVADIESERISTRRSSSRVNMS